MSSETEKIKNLREATGLSFAEIKKALTEAGGDETKASEILAKLGALTAAKKSERAVKEGTVSSYIHSIPSPQRIIGRFNVFYLNFS